MDSPHEPSTASPFARPRGFFDCLLCHRDWFCVPCATRFCRREDWPAWRGPRGDSTSREQGLPLAWNAETGIAWKMPLPEWGTSTPAIWADAIFVTAQHDEDLLALKLDRRTGAIEWTQKVDQAPTPRSGQSASGRSSINCTISPALRR